MNASDESGGTGSASVSAGPPAKASDGESTWIGRGDIAGIEGALKPSAYVARAYQHQRKHDGALPSWARKRDDGKWVFDQAYITADARDNVAYIGVTEAAKRLGATRRAVQNWVDDGVIHSTRNDRGKGAPRRIPRAAFMEALPSLKQRLDAPAVVAFKSRRKAAVDAAGGAAETTAGTKAAPAPNAVDADRAEREARRLEKRLAAAEARLERLAAVREQAEREAENSARSAEREAQREDALRETLKTELHDAARHHREAERRRQAAAKKAQRAAEREAETTDKTLALREAIARQRETVRQGRVHAVASRLEAARKTQREADAATPGRAAEPAHPKKREVARQAKAVAARLQAARESHKQTALLEKKAREMAGRIADDVTDGKIDRWDGAILFNELANEQHVPEDVRVKVTREFFKS